MPRPIIRAPVDGKCRVCGSTEFTTRNRCRPCNREIERARRAKDPEQRRARDAARSRAWRRANPHKLRAQLLRQLYGLTPEQFADMLRTQRDACAVCQKPSSDYCVDHCHVTGRVRGILCRPCNIGIGQLRDDTALLMKAAEYVEEPPCIAQRNAHTRVSAMKRGYWGATNADKQRAADRWKNYRLDGSAFDDMFAAQGGRCLICRDSEATSVDHCHATGRIRGILCRACNAGLGLLRDSPALMRAAARYLKPE